MFSLTKKDNYSVSFFLICVLYSHVRIYVPMYVCRYNVGMYAYIQSIVRVSEHCFVAVNTM